MPLSLTGGPVEGEDGENHDASESTTARLSSRDVPSRSVRTPLLVDRDSRETPVDGVDRLEQRAYQRDNIHRLVFLCQSTNQCLELTC
jgi:hypothetical protein